MKVALWAEIHRLHEIEKLSNRAIALRLHCSREVVKTALAQDLPPTPACHPSRSILDPFTPQIDALIKKYPDLSAVRVLEEVSNKNYPGEITLVRKYLRTIRPARGRVYQEVDWKPGGAMQVDWGNCGVVPVGHSRRKISVFVAVLCFSRLMYVAFTLSQSKQTFYRCIVNALRFFGGSPGRLIVDNLKAAVLEGSGRHALFHPEFKALCGYHRMEPVACEKNDPESKGVVEGGVRYVKYNALKGRDEELTCYQDYPPFAGYWRDEVANVRLHDTTKERPVDRFENERHLLRPLPDLNYDTDNVETLIVTPHARIRFDANRYSVPPSLVRKHVILRANESHVRVFHAGQEVASHVRCYDKHQLRILAEHRQAALALRKRSQVCLIEHEFDELGPEAKAFRLALLTVPVKPIIHLRNILRLVRLYGKAEVYQAIACAVEYRTFDAAYVRNLIDQQRRQRHLPSPIPLTPKRHDLIEDIQLDEPQPGDYDRFLDS